ncbi:hypothetical protein BDB01DRAFT_853428 [Pilobolus umbonatus]|nr:hypothetical protein BDB01DRAFT_853428 [Pilobolus umbonatus]
MTLDELFRKATIDKSERTKYSCKTWIGVAVQLYLKGDYEYSMNDVENAYISYMKGCSIVIEIVPRHPQHKEADRDIRYQELKSKTEAYVLQRLENLKDMFQQREDMGVEDMNDVMDKYPSIEDIDKPETPKTKNVYSLDDLPDVPTHKPAKVRSIPRPENTTVQPSPPPVTMKMPVPQSVPAPTNTTTTDILPRPSNFPLPPMLTVDPSQLASWIAKGNTKIHPSVLLLDVRPREQFDTGFLKHTYICQIEPLVLKPNVMSSAIEQSLIMNPNHEQMLFEGRDRFDIIVYYDQNSTSLQRDGQPLYHLHQAIYEYEFKKILQRAPIMLVGGFEAWRNKIGDHGIYRFPTNKQPSPTETSDTSPDLVPVKVHHTVYDYFTESSGGKQSMSRYRKKAFQAPPLRGVFGNTLMQSSNTQQPITMPIPQPSALPMSDDQPISTSYPDIQPNASNLVRRNTFIDNPFHGFTETANKQYGIPPLPPKPSRPLPPIPILPDKTEVPVIPPKPEGIHHDPSHSYRTAPLSDNSFSQMGNVIIGTTGLKNLGNTCYMNSIIQCLSGTIPFARYFISGTFKNHINKTNFLGTKGEMAESFAELLRTMWSGNYNFISPILFREALLKFAPQFQGSEQHDSQEFLNFLLDGLHEDCNLITERPPPTTESEEEEARFERLPDWEASAIAWDRYLQRNSSVIVSLFQGQFRSRLTCQTCHGTSTTYNSFMSLSLPIPATRKGPASVSIYQCLDYFVKEEVLENDDAWNCPHCKAPRRATKALTLSKLPLVLLIHLKRFSYDGPFKDKLETIVQSPMTNLDLSRYVPSSMIPPDQPNDKSLYSYDLYAVSNHFGSLTGGHYTACVRNTYRKEWHNFDDSRFSVCDESKVLSRAAYNLFYVRSTVQ